MKNNKKTSLSPGIAALVIIAAVIAYNVALDANPDEMIPAVIALIIISAVIGVVVALGKAKAGKADAGKKSPAAPKRPSPRPTAARTKQSSPRLRHNDEVEEAISCHHNNGKEKYLEQVEGFYQNGLIDRAEYRILREKYEKLEIPEDYH